MNEIQNINGEITMTVSSREVAEMMGVRHADLMKKIEKHTEILGKVNERSFSLVDLWQLSSYKDAKGETRKEYQVTKKGCEFLAHKTTGEKGDLFTIRYMNRFEEMEKALKGQNTPSYMIENPVERAKRWILEYQEKEKLVIENQQQTQAIEEMTPKADYFDALVDNNLLTNIRDTAKQLHIKQTAFTKWLIENNFCYRDVRGKLKPYADKMEYFELKEFTTDWGHSDTQTLITPRGKEAFRLLLSKKLQKKGVTSKKKKLAKKK